MSESDRKRLSTLCREMAEWLDDLGDGKRQTRAERAATWVAFGLLREHCMAVEGRRAQVETDEIR